MTTPTNQETAVDILRNAEERLESHRDVRSELIAAHLRMLNGEMTDDELTRHETAIRAEQAALKDAPHDVRLNDCKLAALEMSDEVRDEWENREDDDFPAEPDDEKGPSVPDWKLLTEGESLIARTKRLMSAIVETKGFDETDRERIGEALEWLDDYNDSDYDKAAVAAAVSLITGFPTTARLSPHHLMNDDVDSIAHTGHRILMHHEEVLDEDLDETIEREAGGDESQREHYSRFHDACEGDDELYQDVHIATKVLEWAGKPYTSGMFG